MTIKVETNLGRIHQILTAIKKGGSIRPVGKGWPVSDLLALAGVCTFLVQAAGPYAFRGPDSANIPLEQAKAGSKEFAEEVRRLVSHAAGWARGVSEDKRGLFSEEVTTTTVMEEGSQSEKSSATS